MVSSKPLKIAPGLALQRLLLQTKPGALRGLIGEDIVKTLEGFDKSLLEGDKLGKLASRLIDPAEALRDPVKSAKIVRLLPLPKARELADKLGIEDGKDLFDRLSEAVKDSKSLQTLYSFFGVVQDERAPSQVKSDASKASAGYGLFEHQRIAARKVVKALDALPNKVVLHMPTGAGKTRTAMHIVGEHLNLREPTVVCWLAQNAELLDQAADEFEKAWNQLGNRPLELIRFWGGRQPDITQIRDGVIISGLAKMNAFDNRNSTALLHLADRVSLTVIDEAHQAIAPTYASVLKVLSGKKRGSRLLGLTATPGRTFSDIAEDARLSDFFDNQKVTLEVEGYDDPVSFLIEKGYLARPKFRTLNYEAGLTLSKRDIKKLSEDVDIPDSLLGKLGDDTQRNLKITTGIEELATRHNRIIVFAASVASARLLAAILNTRGYEAHVVTGESGTIEREHIITRYKGSNPSPIIVCNYGVLTTGFDAPATSAAMIARPTLSLVLYSQMVGRATRGPEVDGNPEAEIVTVADPFLPGFGSIVEAFQNWEDVW